MRVIAILVAAAAIVMGACTTRGHPIYNVEKAPIILPPGKSANMTQVSTAIMRAGSRLGWVMNPEGPGRITGRINVKNILAVIDVEHDTKSYSIKYRDSSGLNAESGTIHQRYNGWIQNLDKNIRAELTGL